MRLRKKLRVHFSQTSLMATICFFIENASLQINQVEALRTQKKKNVEMCGKFIGVTRSN